MTRAASLLALVLVLSGCIRETPDVSKNDPSQSTTMTDASPAEGTAERTATMNPPVPPPTSEVATPQGGIAKPQPRVDLIEYEIRMPKSLTAGYQSFNVVNAGKELHSFEIEGNGIEARLPADLPRGDAATFEVNLKPGTYTVYCPVKDHRQKGMTTKITVHQ
jgi:hypothetical protein